MIFNNKGLFSGFDMSHFFHYMPQHVLNFFKILFREERVDFKLLSHDCFLLSSAPSLVAKWGQVAAWLKPQKFLRVPLNATLRDISWLQSRRPKRCMAFLHDRESDSRENSPTARHWEKAPKSEIGPQSAFSFPHHHMSPLHLHSVPQGGWSWSQLPQGENTQEFTPDESPVHRTATHRLTGASCNPVLYFSKIPAQHWIKCGYINVEAKNPYQVKKSEKWIKHHDRQTKSL